MIDIIKNIFCKKCNKENRFYMNRTLLQLLLFMLLFGCSSKSNTNQTENVSIIDSDTLTISQTQENELYRTSASCVVFLMPSDKEIEDMKKEYSEEDYNEIIADIVWYPGIAGGILDSFNIQNEYVTNQLRLRFILSNGDSIEYNKSDLEENMILFRNDTLPILSTSIFFNRDFTLEFFKR